jgi:hypothetical protein
MYKRIYSSVYVTCCYKCGVITSLSTETKRVSDRSPDCQLNCSHSLPSLSHFGTLVGPEVLDPADDRNVLPDGVGTAGTSISGGGGRSFASSYTDDASRSAVGSSVLTFMSKI